MSLYALYHRIPQDWIGFVLGCIVTWGILRLKQRDDLSPLLENMLFNTLLIYILCSRFLAGLLLHLSLNIGSDLLSALDGSVEYGWFFGLGGIVIYLGTQIRRNPKLQTTDAYRWITLSGLLVTLVYFSFLCLVSLHPFRLEFGLRALGILVLLLILLLARKWEARQASLLMVITLGSLLLVTSVLVPQPEVWLWFSPEQWWYIAMVMVPWFFARPALGDRV